MLIKLRHTPIWLWLLLLSSCAQQLSPSGGPEDRKAPELKESYPEASGRNFDGDRIELRFNEYITLKDLNSVLSVSPPIPDLPPPEISGKKLVWKLPKKLEANTTYTFYLGNGIADITEGNSTDNLSLVFSTGNSIDSLKASGKVYLAQSLKAEDKVKVLLFSIPEADSAIFKGPPRYLSKCNKQGQYQLQNLAPGDYRIYGLKDLNNNNRYDGNEELIAFLQESVSIKDSGTVSLPDLKLFLPVKEKQFLTGKTISSKGKLDLIFQNIPVNPEIIVLKPSEKKNWDRVEYNALKDSIVFWYDQSFGDSLHLLVKDGDFTDTLRFRIEEKKEEKPAIPGKRGGGAKITAAPKPLILRTNSHEGKGLYPNENPELEFNIPILKLDTAAIFWITGTDTVPASIRQTGLRKCIISNKLLPKKESALFFLPGAITGAYTQKNDSIRMLFNTMDTRELGEINASLIFPEGDKGTRILQLCDAQDKIQRTYYLQGNEKNISIPFLAQGEYYFRVINDNNANKRWDSGSFRLKKQAETVSVITERVKVKARFTSETELKLP